MSNRLSLAKHVIKLGLAAALLISLTGCGALPDASALGASSLASASTSSLQTAATAVSTTKTLALLATLPVKGKAPKTGYIRTKVFGAAWMDVDHNSCDTRDDILARDLVGAVKSGSCKVLSGTLHDPYTGKTIHFVRGVSTSTLVQIDHVNALSEDWQTGAQQISQTQREALANDPLNLIAVDGRTNEQKGDGDAATWLPPQKSFRCTYVTRQIQVKAKYRLWVTRAEHDAMVRVLGSCSGAAAPVVAAPVPKPVAPAPKPAAPAPKSSTAPTAAGTIHPGSWCPTRGATGVSAAGKMYTCGKKGADAVGKFHWNA
jgi:hypothetical protein